MFSWKSIMKCLVSVTSDDFSDTPRITNAYLIRRYLSDIEFLNHFKLTISQNHKTTI